MPDDDDAVWLWRITSAEHLTAVVVRLSPAVLAAPPGEMTAAANSAVHTRGRSALQATLGWIEPPREITFADPDAPPICWGGTPTGS